MLAIEWFVYRIIIITMKNSNLRPGGTNIGRSNFPLTHGILQIQVPYDVYDHPKSILTIFVIDQWSIHP